MADSRAADDCPSPQPSQTSVQKIYQQTITPDGLAVASSDSPGQGEILQPEQDRDHGIAINASDMQDGLLQAKKRKKRSKKPASKRGLGKPTGFEEFHADGPLTPEQHAESQEAFNPNIPFVDRILKAIQRFERTRKLSPERRNIFYKYLAYGGVDVGPNMFMGSQDTEDMDKDEINTVMAQADISEDLKQAILDPKNEEGAQSTDSVVQASKLHFPEHAAKYVVDFEGTMRGFLSRHAPNVYVIDTEDHVKLVTTTLERFMDYLLQHEVCPEYTLEVLKTRDLCRVAQTELWHCIEAQRRLPGDFNVACSTLFGGSFSQNYDGETYWGPTDTKGDVFVGLKPEEATQIVGFAIAGAATEEVYHKYLDITTSDTGGKGFEIVNTIQEHGFEIVQIDQPSQECKTLYRENTAEFRPVGRVIARFFSNPEASPEDVSPSEAAAADYGDHKALDFASQMFVFFVETEHPLSFLRIGMRVEATIHKLNCGVWFFDEVIRVLPSFDIWLDNELMLGWKEPRPVAGVPRLKWNAGVDMEEEITRDTIDEADTSDIEQEAMISDKTAALNLDHSKVPITQNLESNAAEQDQSKSEETHTNHETEDTRPY